jgi:hypothetical protein
MEAEEREVLSMAIVGVKVFDVMKNERGTSMLAKQMYGSTKLSLATRVRAEREPNIN